MILKRKGVTTKGVSARKWISDFSEEETDSCGKEVRRYRATTENIVATATSLPEVFPLLYVERTWIVNHTSEIVNPTANASKNEPDINSHP